MKRVIIRDNTGIFDVLNSTKKYKNIFEKFDIWTVEEFENKIKDTEDTVFYVCGHEFYIDLRRMNDEGKLHLGLRKFTHEDFMELQFVYIGTNRLIYDLCREFYKYEAPEGRVTKQWIFYKDLLEEYSNNSRPKLNLFLSDECEKNYLKYPKTKIVGLKEGKSIMNNLNKLIIHKYDSAVDYDWWRNPEHRVWENEIGLDFETENNFGNNVGKAFPEFKGTKVTGFALSWSDPYSKDSRAVFFDFRKDYNYNEDNWNEKYEKEYYEFLESFKSFMDNHYKHVWVYNASFEYGMLFVLLRKFYYIQDAYALCIADDKRGSLKYNTQLLLRSPSWDDELDADFDYFRQICDNFKSFEEFEKYEIDYYKYTNDKSNRNDLKDKLKELKEDEKKEKTRIRKEFNYKVKENANEINKEFEKTKLFKELKFYKEKLSFYDNLDKKDYRFIEAMSFFSENNPEKRILLKQHWGNEWGATGVCVNNSKYGTKEENCLGLYCGIDAFVGERLARLLMPAYGNNCYKELLNHRYIATELKMSGIKVDKKKLLEIYKFCWNIDNNYELSENMFVSRLRCSHISKIYLDYYNKFDDFQKNFWKEHSTNLNYFFYNVNEFLFGRTILNEYLDKNKDEQIDLKKFFNSIDCEFKSSYIKKYELQEFNLTNYNKFKEDISKNPIWEDFIKLIGKKLMKRLDTYRISKELNTFNLSIIKDEYESFYKKYSVYWIYDDILPLNKTFKNIYNKKGDLTKTISLFEICKSDKKSDVSLFDKYFREYFNEEQIENLKEIPDDLLNNLNYLVKLDEDYIDKNIYNNFTEIVPKAYEFLNWDDMQQLPTMVGFLEAIDYINYDNKLKEYNTNTSIVNLLKDNTDKIIQYPKEELVNYFSPVQINDFYYTFVKDLDYWDIGKATRSVALCFDKYCEYKHIEVKPINKVDSKELWKAFLEYLNNEEYRNIVNNTPNFVTKYVYSEQDSEEDKKEYDWFGKIDKNNFTKIDTVYNFNSWYSKDALDDCCKVFKLIPNLFNTKTKIYDNFKIDGSILPNIIYEVLDELPKENYELYKDQLSRIWDLIHQGFIRQLASTCNKIKTTYISNVDMGYIKYPFKENLNETGEDTIYGQWEYHPEYSISASKPLGRQDIVDRKGANYLFSEECENWWLNEVPNLYMVTPYSINSAITKRNSSFFHTAKHNADYFNTLVGFDDTRVKFYFDISQLEP